MSDKDIQNWDQRLKNQCLKGWENYIRKRIDLSIERICEFWGIAGEYLYVEEVSSDSASAQIRLNRNTNDTIDLRADAVIKTIFGEFYITNEAQPGEWIDIIVGINFEYQKRRQPGLQSYVRPVVKLTHANPNTNVTPASQIASRAVIKADVANTGIAWIDFGQAAVQNNCLPLDPHESVHVKISNLDQINANFEVGGECVFIVYEV